MAPPSSTLPAASIPSPPAPSLWALVRIFFAASHSTIAGGSAIQAYLQTELVDRRNWITAREFGLIFGLARITPGTNVLATTAALAWRLGGWPAALLGVVAASLPAAIFVALFQDRLQAWHAIGWVSAAIQGAIASVLAVIAFASWKLISPYLQQRDWPRAVLLPAFGFAAHALDLLSPVMILLLGALFSLGLHRLQKAARR